jgi:hypothetical protein
MGASDFTSGDFKNKTRPILKKLETSSKTVESLIDSLIDSKILKVRVTRKRKKLIILLLIAIL